MVKRCVWDGVGIYKMTCKYLFYLFLFYFFMQKIEKYLIFTNINLMNDNLLNKYKKLDKKLKNEKKSKQIEKKKYIPFIEKYRPTHFEDLILPISMQYKIADMIKSNTLPNIIITGSPGTGKTSTILCLANKILGKNKDMILELNASNNRTLEFINTTVEYFCKKKMSIDSTNHNLKKIIIFDEADNITKKAQNSLANLMENHSHNTCFAFTCNESSKIIESIQSRCTIIRYVPINNENIKKRLLDICEKENIPYDDSGINSIIFISQGDIRQAINNLEVAYYGYDSITEENVYKLCYHPHPQIIMEMITDAVDKNLLALIENINKLKNYGYCGSDILLTMLNTLKEIKIDEDIRINFIKIISDCYIIVSEGIDTILQLYVCVAKMIEYIENS